MTDRDRYQIRVKGWIGERWASWFDGIAMSYDCTEDDAPVTTLTSPVIDQAALRGLLSKVLDLNLALISVNRIGGDNTGEGGREDG